MPEPGLIINGVKTAGTGAWKLWNTYLEQKETRDLLRSALARAICPDRPADGPVNDLAEKLEGYLRQTAVPQHQPGKADRAKGFVRRAIPWRLRPRERPEPGVFGPSFAEHLERWLSRAVESHDVADRLAAIDCPGSKQVTVEDVVRRFPAGFELELLREDGEVSDFRRRFATQVLIETVLERERAARVGIAERALRKSAEVLVPGGVAYTAAELAGSGDTTALAAGLAAALLGAVAGGITGDHACDEAARQSAVRGMALAWLAQLLHQLTSRPASPRPDLLQEALMHAMRDQLAGRLTWPESLARPQSDIEQIRLLADDVHDFTLSRALRQVEEALQAGQQGPALGTCVDLLNVAAS